MIKKTIGWSSRNEAFSLALALLGDQQPGYRVSTGVCGNVLLGASSLDGTMGRRRERSMEKTGVGSYVVEKSLRTSWSVFFDMKGLSITFPSWQVLRMGDGNMISMKDTCPDVNKDMVEACQRCLVALMGKESGD